MRGEQFFNESKEQSRVKSAIVAKYFEAWATVIVSTQNRLPQHEQKIQYIDLFAGPGRYEDGTVSTPLLVLERAINNEKLRNRLVTIFNDKDSNSSNSLQKAIANLLGIEKLANQPTVYNEEVGTEIVKMFEQSRLVPTLFFVDPWGYKGLSLRLVNSVLKNWGCECIFFFNYNRINMGLNNPAVEYPMDSLFGTELANELRDRIEGMNPYQRELTIVDALAKALQNAAEDTQPRFVIPFRFRDERGSRTSHHLIFVTKHFKGYEIMKEIMARESSSAVEGVSSFEYSPADQSHQILFGYARPLVELGGSLVQRFAGQTLKMSEVYMQHNIGLRYIRANYKDALVELEESGVIKADPPAVKRPSKSGKKTFGDNVLATFPVQSESSMTRQHRYPNED